MKSNRASYRRFEAASSAACAFRPLLAAAMNQRMCATHRIDARLPCTPDDYRQQTPRESCDGACVTTHGQGTRENITRQGARVRSRMGKTMGETHPLSMLFQCTSSRALWSASSENCHPSFGVQTWARSRCLTPVLPTVTSIRSGSCPACQAVPKMERTTSPAFFALAWGGGGAKPNQQSRGHIQKNSLSDLI